MKLWHELWGNLGKSILSKGLEVGGSLAYSRNSKKTGVTSTAQEGEREGVGNAVGGWGAAQGWILESLVIIWVSL